MKKFTARLRFRHRKTGEEMTVDVPAMVGPGAFLLDIPVPDVLTDGARYPAGFWTDLAANPPKVDPERPVIEIAKPDHVRRQKV